MKSKLLVLIFLLSGVGVSAFENQPWFAYPYEFHFRTELDLSYYTSVEGGIPPVNDSSWNQVLTGNLGVNTLSQFDTQIEVAGFNTTRTTATLLSAGIQERYQFLDDITGDPISLAVGVNFRFVPGHSLTDPYCPYHGIANFEANIALGKEFDHLQFWVYRFYAIGAVGMANKGSPWARGFASFEFNGKENKNQCGVNLDSYFGFGDQTSVNVAQFDSYANIRHQSVDLSAFYRRAFESWGALSIQLGYRVYAENYPQNLIGLQIKYDLPFSVF